jgi:septal ring factor EnvC (AmiA/AmiB activator)
MKPEFLSDFLNTIIYLVPVLALVWKGATMAAKLKEIEANVKEKTDKFCKDHREMAERIEEERKSTDRSIDAIMNTLTDIKTSLARVETKLEERK